MKKGKLSTGLVTSFIAAMALGACSPAVTNGKGNLVGFEGHNGQDISIATDELYNEYKTSSSGISAYYDSIMEVLIRNAFAQNKKDGDVLKGIKKNYDQILNEAKNNVKNDKQTARENADTNGTSYKTEWQSILTGKNVEDEAELLQQYIYQIEKETIEDWYFDQNEETLTKEYLGIGDDGKSTASDKASSKLPYHIRHILIKNEDGAKDFVRGSISANQAKLLSQTIQMLATGDKTFGEVALLKSEDTSNTSYGDVGIMTNSAASGSLGMVNEFQLGIYAYDAIYGRTTGNPVIEEGLGLTAEVKKTLNDIKLGELPYAKVVELGLAAEIEVQDSTGLKVGDGASALYPRNILWNKYFNRHNAFVITNATTAEYALGATNDDFSLTVGESTYANTIDVKGYDETTTKIDFTKLAGFQADSVVGSGKVLKTTDGQTIIGVRSQFGIHLMVVEKSIYDFKVGGTDKDAVSLEEYYTTAVPGDNDYPTYDDGNKKTDKKTYVNFIETENKSEYNARATEVKNAIKNFDSTYDYRLYDLLSGRDDETRATLFDVESDGYKLLEEIDNYIDLQREKNLYDQEEGLEKVWRTYLELVELQEEYKESGRVIPEGCKIGFTKSGDHDSKEYEKGGKCYVG
jgi:hypothetical protein